MLWETQILPPALRCSATVTHVHPWRLSGHSIEVTEEKGGSEFGYLSQRIPNPCFTLPQTGSTKQKMSEQPMTATHNGPNLPGPPRCGRVAAGRPGEYKVTALSAIHTWFVRTSRSLYIRGAGAHVSTLQQC